MTDTTDEYDYDDDTTKLAISQSYRICLPFQQCERDESPQSQRILNVCVGSFAMYASASSGSMENPNSRSTHAL